MPRIVTLSSSTPLKIDPNLSADQAPPAPNVIAWPRDAEGRLKVLSICTCGVSAKFPLCDGAHKTCKDEDPSRLYQYESGVRREVPDAST